MSNLAPPPLQTPIVEIARAPGVFPGEMTTVFADWLRALVDRAQVAAYRYTAVVFAAAQTASIGATSLIPLAPSGYYRVTYRVRLTVPATVSSSILVTVTSEEGGVACSQSSVAYTGNLVDEPQTGSFVVKADANTTVGYSTTYASVGATAMEYEIDLIVEGI